MVTPLSSSAPTLPYTGEASEGLPNLSPPDEDDVQTQVMPSRMAAEVLALVGEHPIVNAPVELAQSVWIENTAADAATECPSTAWPAHPDDGDAIASVAAPGPMRRRQRPSIAVWIAVVVCGAALGLLGGLTAASATSSVPAVVGELASDVAPVLPVAPDRPLDSVVVTVAEPAAASAAKPAAGRAAEVRRGTIAKPHGKPDARRPVDAAKSSGKPGTPWVSAHLLDSAI